MRAQIRELTRRAREDAQLSQQEVGTVFGVIPQTVSHWEMRKNCAIPIHYAERFCILTNVSPLWLLTGTPPIRRPNEDRD